MRLEETQKALTEFAKYVIQQSRTNLSKGKKNASNKLYDSLDHKLHVGANSIDLDLLMADYGKFVDKGVSGTHIKYNTPYSYRQKQPPLKAILPWVKQRRIRFRDQKGRYTKGTYKSIAFVIARSIKRKGIKPSLFFTKPFEAAFKKLPTDLVEAFALDVYDFIEFTTEQNGKHRS